MKKIPFVYSAEEEHLNALTHGIAAIVALIGTIILCIMAGQISWQAFISVTAYGLSLVLLFTASTLYHSSHQPQKRLWFKKLDHTAIYYLIAGTYTPFLALFIPTMKAKVLLIVLWLIALMGTGFKLFFVDRFEKLSLAAYIAMGWCAIFVIQDMRTFLNQSSLYLLVLGGVFYTVGTFFYASQKIKFAHVIWHIFVNLGAASHFFAVWMMLKQVIR
ncbi:hemolysin III family protein [Acinetobacter qingfengensis]|uniref:Hemolysin III n=1 Tax=Acinetobacter qingfengensis TaxID=1262585 RepID=A0A1E7RF26_9GAMM|nr:hemolysin III family protein [Acinetobacter qingfengensis]KAA8731902.1 hemolysin III family protein [Acinetobacter qingfengensis]OEY97974.1 hemolysin III [Acinetobacter qingfengensis]